MDKNFFDVKPTTGIAVDASTTGGNPGWSEYRGIDLSTGKQLFRHTIGMSTNNIAEFIGLCHGLMYAIEHKYVVVYSDSQTARAWVKNKACKTNQKKGPKTTLSNKWMEQALLRIASVRINGNNFDSFFAGGSVNICKWETNHWGENPADFGRK